MATEKILTVEALQALPVGSVLRHPSQGALVELRPRVLNPGGLYVRINGHGVNIESLYPDWDFPMELLYRPEESG